MRETSPAPSNLRGYYGRFGENRGVFLAATSLKEAKQLFEKEALSSASVGPLQSISEERPGGWVRVWERGGVPSASTE